MNAKKSATKTVYEGITSWWFPASWISRVKRHAAISWVPKMILRRASKVWSWWACGESKPHSNYLEILLITIYQKI